MADEKNYINDLMGKSLSILSSQIKNGNVSFPPNWDKKRKLLFLQDCLNFAIKLEYYESCGDISGYIKKVEEER